MVSKILCLALLGFALVQAEPLRLRIKRSPDERFDGMGRLRDRAWKSGNNLRHRGTGLGKQAANRAVDVAVKSFDTVDTLTNVTADVVGESINLGADLAMKGLDLGTETIGGIGNITGAVTRGGFNVAGHVVDTTRKIVGSGSDVGYEIATGIFKVADGVGRGVENTVETVGKVTTTVTRGTAQVLVAGIDAIVEAASLGGDAISMLADTFKELSSGTLKKIVAWLRPLAQTLKGWMLKALSYLPQFAIKIEAAGKAIRTFMTQYPEFLSELDELMRSAWTVGQSLPTEFRSSEEFLSLIKAQICPRD